MPEAMERPPGKLLPPFPWTIMGSSPARRTIWLKRIDRPRLLCPEAPPSRDRGPRGMMRRHVVEMLNETFVEGTPTHLPVFFCWNRRNPVPHRHCPTSFGRNPQPCSGIGGDEDRRLPIQVICGSHEEFNFLQTKHFPFRTRHFGKGDRGNWTAVDLPNRSARLRASQSP